MPLPTKLADSQLDEKEFVARSVIKINTGIDGAYVVSSGKDMGVFKATGFPEDVGRDSTVWRNMRDTAGQRTAGIQPTRRAGGAARTRLRCSIIPSSTTGRSHPTTRTAVSIEMFGYSVYASDGYRGHHLHGGLSCAGNKGLTLEEMAECHRCAVLVHH